MHRANSLSWAGNVDELVAARTELARLQQEELQLLKQLFDVRAAASAQGIKIDALVRERNRTISCLPAELLDRIFNIYIHLEGPEEIYWRMHQLASVSRYWRDTILCTPTFWTCVMISPDDTPFLETRLKRSHSALLDIVIMDWMDRNDETELIKSLRIVASCANRWRSLTMDMAEINKPFTVSVIDEINHLEFPRLQRANIELSNNWYLPLPAFLSSKNSPTLEHISLGHLIVQPGFPTQSKLKTLKLTNVSFRLLSPAVLFSQSLIELSLVGTMDGSLLEPDSIKFPVLRTLILHSDDPQPLLEAILAPMLEYFDYSHRSVQDSDATVFGRVKNKFDAVHHLAFSLGESYCPGATCGVILCQAFPGVRCLTIKANEMGRIFLRYRCKQRRIMDDCSSLEQVTISCTDCNQTLFSMDSFIWWLTNRIGSGQGRLRVKLTGTFPPITETRFVAICDQLRECCILELDNVVVTPLVHLSMSEHSPLRVVSTSSSK